MIRQGNPPNKYVTGEGLETNDLSLAVKFAHHEQAVNYIFAKYASTTVQYCVVEMQYVEIPIGCTPSEHVDFERAWNNFSCLDESFKFISLINLEESQYHFRKFSNEVNFLKMRVNSLQGKKAYQIVTQARESIGQALALLKAKLIYLPLVLSDLELFRLDSRLTFNCLVTAALKNEELIPVLPELHVAKALRAWRKLSIDKQTRSMNAKLLQSELDLRCLLNGDYKTRLIDGWTFIPVSEIQRFIQKAGFEIREARLMLLIPGT